MIDSFIPSFDFKTVFIDTWTVYLQSNLWIFLMGFWVSLACGLVGNFIILRRMALVGDAISHSLLPGIAIAFLISASRATPTMVLGAILAGILTTVFIEYIHKKSRIKSDAAIGIVFSTFFAVGVILITLFADKIDLDADCVLYGEIAYVPFHDSMRIAGLNFGPFPVVRMAAVTLLLVGLITLFYKELLVTSFDTGLAKSLGIHADIFHYGLMGVLSVVIVSAFESVGAILVIAMLIFPGATASLLCDRLPRLFLLTVVFALLYALLGLHLAVWLQCSIAGAMTVVAGLLFALTWIFSPRKGLLRFWRKQRLEPWPVDVSSA